MTERKLASVRRIDEIVAIEGADSIECAVVGGWNVVVKKGEFKAGDLARSNRLSLMRTGDSYKPLRLLPFPTPAYSVSGEVTVPF